MFFLYIYIYQAELSTFHTNASKFYCSIICMSINPFMDARALEVAKNAQKNKEPLKKEVNSR